MLSLKEILALFLIKIYKQLLQKLLKQELFSICKINLDNEVIELFNIPHFFQDSFVNSSLPKIAIALIIPTTFYVLVNRTAQNLNL